MSSKQLPASIRYLKARLKILQRPSVWVSASVLLGAMVFLADTWNHPERFTASSTASDSLPDRRLTVPTDAEALARPAPLDPLSTVEEAPFVTPATPPPFASSEDFTRSSSGDRQIPPLPLPSTSTPSSAAPLAPNPFASIRSDRSATDRSSSSGTGSLSNSGLSSSSQPSTDSQPSPAANPLQSALDRYASPTPAQPPTSLSPQSSPTPDPNAAGNPSAELQPPVAPPIGQSSFVQPQPLPGQPSYGQTQPQPQFVPQTSPAPGTTGYTMPPAFRTNANTSAGPSFGPYRNNPSAAPTTGFSSTSQPEVNPTVQPQPRVSQPQTSPAPFSVPRDVPGRTIGGGEINTFSNP